HLPFAVGEQLLLYTDGVTEARDHAREFYPLAAGVARHVSDDPARTLDAVHDELLEHVGGQLHDDAALLLLRRQAADGQVPALPRTEIGL
ncbi:SpoIIE family protein phosphatase, partial [Streptomyces broussonetiae]|uniref:SpoIIE family protein phosphatase n=1 Tax=Streptomyces broussonetiae TaxID=2686304 RepID=UPI0035D805DE